MTWRELAGVAIGAEAHPAEAIGGSVFAGITRTVRSPYLLNIGLFLLLFSVTSTFLYFEQAGIAKRSFPDRGAQTAFFASVDLLVNLLTLGVQWLAMSGAVIIALPPMLLVIVGGGLILIAMMSGMLSLGVLKNSQPADLLR